MFSKPDIKSESFEEHFKNKDFQKFSKFHKMKYKNTDFQVP